MYVCVYVCAVSAQVPVDSPERATCLRADGSAAETQDRSLSGEERNKLLSEQRGQERSPGQSEEEDEERRTAGKFKLHRRNQKVLIKLRFVSVKLYLQSSGGREDVGLHAATDRGGDPEEETEILRPPEAPGQGPPPSPEEPIKCLPAGQDFQFQSVIAG